MNLSSRNQRTLRRIFARPVEADIKWREIERLLHALGADISEGRGSRMRVALNGVRAVFHRPHPQPETDKGALVSVQRFLQEAGIDPEEE